MNKKALTLSIVIMLVLAAAASVYIMHRGREMREARLEKDAQAREALAELRGGAAEEILVKAAGDAAEALAASHVYSHRGSAGPEEHSFTAYDAAIEAGSRYIEPDIVISSDGVLYVSHDLNAASMTGYSGDYSSMSSDTIDGLRTFAGNKILRLSEVFDRYGSGIEYVIELKSGSDECIAAFEEMVDRYGLSGVITVQSASTEVLRTLEGIYPDMPKLFVCKSQADFGYAAGEAYVDIISVSASAGLMTESNCTAAHEQGKLFSAWTLDSEEMIRSAIDMGVDTYFTNDTPLALSLEREYGLKTRKKQA